MSETSTPGGPHSVGPGVTATGPPLSADPPLPTLHAALQAGQPEDVGRLLRLAPGAGVNARDSLGRTPLMLAVEADSPEAVELLLAHGAEPNEANHFGLSVLYLAASTGRLACCERLLRGGALVNAFTLRLRRTALHIACAEGDQHTVELLLRFGADANVIDYGHRAPLHLAAAGGFACCVQLLVRHGARVNALDLTGATPLSLARGDACLRELVEVGAALSPAGFRCLVRESPTTLMHILDLGVKPAEEGGVQISYKPLRDYWHWLPLRNRLCTRDDEHRLLGAAWTPRHGGAPRTDEAGSVLASALSDW
ncbi:ankyrin repeat and protein kinase domain-containing protein 1-like [Pollicipes pollicipes]|uniref:ankyrin repeat and protein kinase domain-containing protein 1-like n=1 Tax=Pollicipes pollicipes TaxID=41117 RepID=UPI0018857105|nr:ankyrin repeat and protein kinase domain-containing protein 1-like [Pollicipes pollicipes]